MMKTEMYIGGQTIFMEHLVQTSTDSQLLKHLLIAIKCKQDAPQKFFDD